MNIVRSGLLSAGAAVLIFSPDAMAATKLAQTNNAPHSASVSNSGPGSQFNVMVGTLDANGAAANMDAIQKVLAALKVERAKDRQRRDPLFVKLERYIVATNPTELQIASASIQQWLGDSESSVTIEIANPSTLPAESVSMRILAPLKPGQTASEALVLRRSQSIPESVRRAIYLPQNKNTSLPIGFVSELIAALDDTSLAEYELLGVGSTPEVPPEMRKAALGNAKTYATQTINKVLGIEIKYKTIFDQELVRLFPLHFYFMKGHPGSAPVLRAAPELPAENKL